MDQQPPNRDPWSWVWIIPVGMLAVWWAIPSKPRISAFAKECLRQQTNAYEAEWGFDEPMPDDVISDIAAKCVRAERESH